MDEKEFKFPRRKSRALMKQYKNRKKIFAGNGTIVYRASVICGGEKPVILKMVDSAARMALLRQYPWYKKYSEENLGEEVHKHALAEARALRRLGVGRHPNVLSMYNCYHDEKDRYFFETERCEMSLREYMGAADGGVLSPERATEIMRDVLRGLQYIHECKMCHKDIQAANIFITDCGVAKIGDFGVTAMCPASGVFPPSDEVNPTRMRPPEILLRLPYTQAVDVWAAGCLYTMCLRREHVFVGDSAQEQLNIVGDFARIPVHMWDQRRHQTLYFPPQNDPDFDSVFDFVPRMERSLLKLLLDPDPVTRISAAVATMHPVFGAD